MKIKKEIIDLIAQKSEFIPYEIGGILGMGKNTTVDHIEFDIPKFSDHPCTYCPNVNYLNGIIEKWTNEDIGFIGIFHTHFANVDTLSVGDKGYIYHIMQSVSDKTDKLYFPIFTLPDKKLKLYSAVLLDGCLCIEEERVEAV